MAFLEEVDGESLLSVPPTGFKRMLSWQLSQVQEHEYGREKKREKKKKKNRKRSSEEQWTAWAGGGEQCLAEPEDESPLEGEDESGDGEVAVDSEGEEEMFYSAPESPLSSDELEPDSTVASHDLSRDITCLPPHQQRRGKKKKSRQKRKRAANRLAMMEFFQPLCDLVEEKLSVDVGEMSLSSKTAVPSLAELCLKSLQKVPLGENLAPTILYLSVSSSLHPSLHCFSLPLPPFPPSSSPSLSPLLPLPPSLPTSILPSVFFDQNLPTRSVLVELIR